jgi:hypothetical protein
VAYFPGNDFFFLGGIIMKYGKQFFALTLAAGGIFLFAPNLHAQETAFFREAHGTVETKAAGSTLWVKAVAGDRIENSTIISTGFRSSAVVVLGDSVVTVRPVTRLSLEEIIRNQNGERVNLYLQTGRVRADVNPPVGGKTEFTVRSPTATASVRGTSFEFDTEQLRVDEGRVQYTHTNGRETPVAAGGMSYVDEANNTVISPFEAAAERLTPASPVGSGSGSGDNAPAFIPGANVGVGFGWD